jgi:hypothetical protein
MGLRPAQLLASLGFPQESTPPPLPTAELAGLESEVRRKFSTNEENILKLLADGHSQEVVASTLGITPSAISQHLAKDWFKEELAARKSLKLDRYAKLDDSYDSIEGKLLQKLENTLPFLSKPGEIAAVLSKVNAAKRRLGDHSKVQNTPVTQIINITLPTQVVHKFSKTVDGHIVAVDNKSLVTIGSNSMENAAKVALALEHEENMKNDRPPV